MRYLGLIIFAVLVLLLMIPNFLIWRGGAVGITSFIDSPILFFWDVLEVFLGSKELLWGLAIEIAIYAVLRKLFLWVLINFVFLMVLPLEIFYVIEYGAPSSAHVLSVIAETNSDEVVGFLGSSFLWFFLYLMWLLILFLVVVVSYRLNLGWRHRSKAWVVMFFLPFFTLNFVSYALTDRSGAVYYHSDDLYLNRLPYGLDEVSSIYPFGLLVRVAGYFQQESILAAHAVALKKDLGDHIRSRNPDLEENYVFVIGESSRADRWGVNGYVRATTPRLSARNDIINFSNAVSVTSATRTSVPILLSKTHVDDLARGDFKASWLSDFKRAGFETYWVSMQMPVGVHDTTVGIYAALADNVRYVNFGTYKGRGGYDGDMLPILSGILSDGKRKRLIILHTLGSHAPYQWRYPREFEGFRPVLDRGVVPNVLDSSQREFISNSYDDSVLYTDYFLNEVMNSLERQPGVAAMWYSSDHGESLFDLGCSKAGHGFFSRYNFHVPMLFWYSASYDLMYPDIVSSLKRNSNVKVYSGDFYYSFLQSAGFSLMPDELKRSFAGGLYAQRKRLVTVDGSVMLDYDESPSKLDCTR